MDTYLETRTAKHKKNHDNPHFHSRMSRQEMDKLRTIARILGVTEAKAVRTLLAAVEVSGKTIVVTDPNLSPTEPQ